MKALTKTKAVGGSIMVVIPRNIIAGEGIKPDEIVEIEISKPKKEGFGILKNIKPFTKKDEEWHD